MGAHGLPDKVGGMSAGVTFEARCTVDGCPWTYEHEDEDRVDLAAHAHVENVHGKRGVIVPGEGVEPPTSSV